MPAHLSIAEQVAAARERFRDYLSAKQAAYTARHLSSSPEERYIVAFCGPGRAGKDQSALYLSQETGLVFGSSTSQVMLPLVAWSLDLPENVAFARRHENRTYWYDWLVEFRRDDPAVVARMTLADGDIVVGIRSLDEFRVAWQQGVIHYPVWVSNPRAPPDPTMTFTEEECPHVLLNHGDLSELQANVRTLADTFHLLRKKIG